MADWQTLPSDLPDLFDRLRALEGAEVCVRFAAGVTGGPYVEIPAALLQLRGTLQVQPGVDRFGVRLPGLETGDPYWLARRRGRGRPDYWQGAVEHHVAGAPALVLYFTAALDGLEIRVRPRDGAVAGVPREETAAGGD